MKRLFEISFQICLLLFLGACNKDPEVPKASLSLIENEPTIRIEDEKVSVFFSGIIDYKGKIKEVVLKIGINPDMSDAVNYTMQLDDVSFSKWVPNLNPDTEYRYCYCIDYGVSADYVIEPKTVMTPSLPVPTATLPNVVTEEVTTMGVIGNVISDGGAYVTERGICWGKEPLPDISGEHEPCGVGTGSFMMDLPVLEPGGIYYVRAYATNSVGTAYGDDLLLLTK